jgi:hypothetical protein
MDFVIRYSTVKYNKYVSDMIRIAAATIIKDRDFNSEAIVERALNGQAAAVRVPGVVPVES